MRKTKNTSKIIIALSVAFLATAVAYTGFRNMNKQLTEQQKFIESIQKNKTQDYNNNTTFAYAITTKDLKAGELVSDEDVDFKQFSALNVGAFENRSDVVNKVLLKDIASGNVLTSEYIAKVSNDDVALKAGFRALTLPAENFQGKSIKMTTGSNVDIYSAVDTNDWRLENIKIIAFEGAKPVGNLTTTDIMNATAITFEVPANGIAEFISNISKSKLVLVARNPNDKIITHKKSSSASIGSYSGGSSPSLPNLPATVPISNFPKSSLSGLPQPLKPMATPREVEMIEANVKSKVTFD